MRPEPGDNERGAALLTVLLLVAVMAVVASAALERLTLTTRLVGNAGAVDQARAYADAAEALARLRIGDLVDARPGRTTLQGGWLGTPQPLPVPGGTAVAQVSDAGNCFNLNSVVSGDSEANLKVRPVGVTQFEALMQLLGIDARQATIVSNSLVDWIDTDGAPQPAGAEDAVYVRAATPHLTANRFMTDASELRVVNGVTPAIYEALRPWICALPVADLSPINVNTLLPDQAPLLAMLLPQQLSVAQARQMLAQRPAGGYGSSNDFWKPLQDRGLTPLGEVSEQVKVATRWFKVDLLVSVGGVEVSEAALIDAKAKPVRIVRRQESDAA
jgi:general secretion pathway protein K